MAEVQGQGTEAEPDQGGEETGGGTFGGLQGNKFKSQTQLHGKSIFLHFIVVNFCNLKCKFS